MHKLIPVFAFLATIVPGTAGADEGTASGPLSGAPNPPPAEIPQQTTIRPGNVGGTPQPNVLSTPENPSQAPTPSAPGVVITIPID